MLKLQVCYINDIIEFTRDYEIMLISLNWLKEITDIDSTPSELDYILTMLGIEVEKIYDYSEKYKNFVTGHVLSVSKHPDADKLTVCEVNTGDTVRTIICGAPNVADGQYVPVGLPGAKVPQNGLVLEKRKVRGIVSEGMICSRYELELGEDHGGIWPFDEEVPPGTKLSEYLGLNDVLFEISITPNRSDCLSHIGIAREIAAYTGKKIKIPEIKLNEEGNDISTAFVVEIDNPEACPRYTARIIRGIQSNESPEWLKNRLTMLGLRPINAVVDVTNLVMLECGQPLHAFDLDKLSGNRIIVKNALDGETFKTLDDKERELKAYMLMISNEKNHLAIAGVMGGADSGISADTKNLLIESAYFNPSSVRKTSKALSLLSDSSYRFERGVDFDNIDWASARAASLIHQICGGNIEKGLIDNYPIKIERSRIVLRFDRVRSILGIDINDEMIKGIIERFEFKIIESKPESLLVEIPAFKTDVKLEIDLIEEIARLFNYDNIEPDFTSRIDFSGGQANSYHGVNQFRNEIRSFLVGNGFSEILSQHLADPKLAAHFSDDPVKVSNPLTEELSVMRPSMLPSMLKTIERNIRTGTKDLKLFELDRTFHKGNTEANYIPDIFETEELCLAITGNFQPVNWASIARESDYYDLKGILSNLLASANVTGDVKFVPGKDDDVFPKNCADIYSGKILIGKIGEVKRSLLKKYEIEQAVFVCLIDFNKILGLYKKFMSYKAVSQFPGSARDLAFILDESVSSADVIRLIKDNGGKFLANIGVFDVYKGKNIGEGKKSLAFNLYFSSNERTLTDSEIDEAIGLIENKISEKLNGILRKF
jgi:phenylalanyl-tRNA synthetase beta chain